MRSLCGFYSLKRLYKVGNSNLFDVFI